MTKMAATPIYKNPLEIFPGTTGLILMKLFMKHQRPNPIIVYTNYDLGLTLTYLTDGNVKFCNLGFYMGKSDNDRFFLEIIAPCDLAFGL